MKREFGHFGIVTLLFLLSLVPRLKNIQTGEYPAVIPHLQVLQVLKVWDREGGARHAYMPVQTWTNPNDKFITYFHRLQNAEGNNYYVSYPPFAFVLAYGFCQLPGQEISVLSITILNLLLQLLAAYCVFGMARQLFPEEKKGVFWPGIVAAALFIGNPASMRLYSQVYFSEAVGTTLLCVFFYFAIRLSRNPRSYASLAGTGISLFLLTYAEWVGIFAGLVFGIFWLVKAFRDRRFARALPVVFVAVAGALLLFAWQLDVVSRGDFYDTLEERYMARTGMREREQSVGDTVFKDGFWEWMASDLRVTFFAARWFLPVLLLITLCLRIFRRSGPLGIDRLSRILSGLVFAVLLLNFSVFFNFNVMHVYTWAKWGILLGLVGGYCAFVCMREPVLKGAVPVWLAALFVTDLLFYRGQEQKDAAPVYWEGLTEFIRQEARPDETVFMTGTLEGDPTFHLTYYTERNLVRVKNCEEAEDITRSLCRKKLVWFEFNEFEGSKIARHIELP